jgi:pimeloyl-ACP methyl ester carboxylesterase
MLLKATIKAFVAFFMLFIHFIDCNTRKPMKQNSWYEEEVTYQNQGSNITLSGTLTLPDTAGTHPAVVLIAGYGPNDRDVTGMGHKYFKVLAEYLTSCGIAVLRFDKRGVGKSTGDWSYVTSKELAQDVCAGIVYLKTRKEVSQNEIGLIGLSEGGLIAAIVAASTKDVSFLVLMAPYVALGVDDMVYHAGLQLKVDGASSDFIERDKGVRTALYTIAGQESNPDVAAQNIRKVIMDYLENLPKAQKNEAENLPWALNENKIDMWTKVLVSPAYRFFLAYDPVPALKAIKVPVLVVVGSLDLTTSPDRILPILRNAFEKSGNKDCTLVELPNLNHLFQTCKTGALTEYATIAETMAPIALKTIADWIVIRTMDKR